MLWGENRGKWKKPAVAGNWTQDTSGLSRQCSATEAQQPDNHQSSCIFSLDWWVLYHITSLSKYFIGWTAEYNGSHTPIT